MKLIALLLFAFQATPSEPPPAFKVDVCIYGGTSAGVIAAYTARQYGKSVLLIEPGRHLGGMTSSGLGQTDIGNKYAITGLARDFYRRVGRYYGTFEAWMFEPKVAEQVFESYVDEVGVEILFSRRLKDVTKTGTEIEQITLEYAGTGTPTSDLVVEADVFIDASYEGDLMAMADVSYTIGREGNDVYGETLNGVQMLSRHQFPDGVDPYVVPGDSASGLLPEITQVGLDSTGAGDRKVQAYNFRNALCDGDSLRLPIPKPEGYDPARYELLFRLIEKAGFDDLEQVLYYSRMPNGKTDWNNNGGFSTDFIGHSWDWPGGSYAVRDSLWQAHEAYQKGLFYALAHERRVPATIREAMQTWGLCRDEFLETGGWPHQLYVREARRMIGAYVMTEHNATGRETVEDGVGMAAYTMDSHNTQRVVVDGPNGPQVKNEGNVEVGGWPGDDRGGEIKVRPYPIAYRSITPNPDEATNLLVPVALSASHIAYGSIRMEPVFMVLAQSAAVAAVMAMEADVPVQDVDVVALQEELRTNPLADGSTPEILVDNADEADVEITAYWTEVPADQTYGGYGPSALYDGGIGADGVVRFKPSIEAAGRYDVYLYWPRLRETEEQAATNVPVDVQHAEGRDALTVDQRAQAGDWFHLGTFSFEPGQEAYVEVRNDRADGLVFADAVLFKPAS